MKIIVTGASGVIGRRLIYKLITKGHEVRALARSKASLPELPPKNVIPWSDKDIPNSSDISEADAFIHLAGEGIADKYWTKSRKRRLWDSRVVGTKNLVTAITSLPEDQRPKVFISGSAIGIYGSGNDSRTEDDSPGSGFLSDLCNAWENQAEVAQKQGVRTILLRTGLVLSQHGGLLAKSGPVILGNGKQWMSWIHIDDLVNFIIFSLDKPLMSGPYNLTAPNPVTNAEFTKAIAGAMAIPMTVKTPAFVLKAILGEMSDAILANQKAIPQRTLLSGFKFKYENLKDAISDLLGNNSPLENKFSTRQFVPKPRHEVFSFFGAAENLEILTPPWLNFHITKKSTDTISMGSLIDYKLKIHKIPVRWRTKISEWNPESSFVDDQLKGPYKKWHHVHTFESVPGGTLISDDVTFQMPGGIFGKLVVPIVKKDVQAIFNYRQEKIREIYLDGCK